MHDCRAVRARLCDWAVLFWTRLTRARFSIRDTGASQMQESVSIRFLLFVKRVLGQHVPTGFLVLWCFA